MGKNKVPSKKQLVKVAKKSANAAVAEAKGVKKTLKAEGKAAVKQVKKDHRGGKKKKVVVTAAAFAGAYLVGKKLGLLGDDED